jgi:DNA-binding transcriptional LysR family regulator
VRMNDFIGFMHEMVAFVLVAESGSFSKAAQQLAMTPSAVSRQISRLEKAMGVKLMHRTTRQLRLTEAGLDVLERGREMVDAAKATMQAAEEHMRAPKGLVRVSAPKAFARHVLQPCLLSFLARYPDVDVHAMVVDRRVDGLRENVDLVIRLTDDPPQGMVARSLMPVQQWVVASPGYLSAHDAIGRPEDLVNHSCLSLGEQDRDNRWRFSRDDETREVLVRGRFTINHSEMRLDAVSAGFGVGCVPDFVAREAVEQGRVVRVLPEWAFQANYQGTAYLLYAAARYTTPKVRVLIEHLMDALSISR